MGKPRDPDYWRRYRATHPEYRERERDRMRRRTDKSHGDRAGQYRRRRERLAQANGDHGAVLTSHPIMDQAAVVAMRYVRPDRRTLYTDALYEEALMTAALAILEGADPHQAVRDVVHAERLWRWRTTELVLR